MRLPLDDGGAGQHLVAMSQVANAEGDQIASAKLTVDARVEQRQIPQLVRVLKVDADGPDVFGLQRRLLSRWQPDIRGSALLGKLTDDLLKTWGPSNRPLTHADNIDN